MLIQAARPLFPWDELDVSPTLATIREALATIPDAQLLAALNQRRRLLIGIGSEEAAPNGWNITRFLAVLGQAPYLDLLRGTFDHMVKRLGLAVPNLGRHTAGNSTGLCGRREPNAARVEAEIEDGLPQASGGRKEYKDGEGKVTKVVEWFGYKLHLLVDATHEVVLGYHIPDTKLGDNECIGELVE